MTQMQQDTEVRPTPGERAGVSLLFERTGDARGVHFPL
jgi:hypothetical protein